MNVTSSPTGTWPRVLIGAGVLGVGGGALRVLDFGARTGNLDLLDWSLPARDLLYRALVGLVAGALLARLSRGRGRLPRAGLVLAGGVLGWLLLTHRLFGGEAWLVPSLDSTKGRLVNGTLLLVALAAAGVVGGPRSLVGVPWLRRGLLGATFISWGAALAVLVSPLAGDRARWPERPNLILISIDTLRADHLGCYGYDLPTSPELDRFAGQSMRFERAWSSDPWTLTSHATMLTGLNSTVHGVDSKVALSPRVATLAQVLADEGYGTMAVVDNCGWMDPRFGFARGFNQYVVDHRKAPGKSRRALGMIDRHGGKPFFLFAHFYDVHSDWTRLPYDSDPEDQALFTDGLPGELEVCDEQGRCASKYLVALNKQGKVMDEEQRRHLTALYDAGIRTFDRWFGRFLRDLESRGLLENSVIIVTADHGEEFFEHGACLHSNHHVECLHVPLLVRTPQTSGEVSNALAALEDLAPTLADFAGTRLPEPTGFSLRDVVEGRATESQRTMVTSGHAGVVRSLRLGEWAAVEVSDGTWVAVGPDGEMALEELGGSVGEDLRAALEAERERVARLTARFAVDQGSADLSAKQQEHLQSLGYVGGEEEDE
jgi:arylsulfatase A-like enzyme